MNLFIVANFTSLPDEKGNCRFNYLAKLFSKEGIHVTLVTSSFSHVEKIQRKKRSYKSIPYKIVTIDEPGYKKNISIRRFFSHRKWGKNVIKYIRSKEVDAIYCAIPSLTASYELAKYSRKYGLKFFIDVQDLWPEAFRMVFNMPIISKLIYAPFSRRANFVYKNADGICAVSKTYSDYAIAKNKKCKKAHTVYLGTDLKVFDDNSKKNSIVESVSSNYSSVNRHIIMVKERNFKLQKPSNEIWVAYCGTLGSSYDLDTVIKAVAQINNIDIRLIIMGDGPLQKKFVQTASDNGIKATFTGRIAYDKMCNILMNCDIAVNPITRGAAGSIINKHADYTAAGLPIVSTQENVEFCDLLQKYNIGFNCHSDNIKQISTAILKLALNKKLRIEIGKNSRACAEELFDRAITYKEIIDAVCVYDRPKIQTLVSTIGLKTKRDVNCLVDKIGTNDAIIINQDPQSKLNIEGKKYTIKTFSEKGLSRSRNRAIKFSNAEICHIIDDDVELHKGYERIISHAYNKHKKADVICFFVRSKNKNRITKNQRESAINLIKSMRVSSSQITFKKDSIASHSIKFDENFGAGTKKYSSGEDSIFLADCLRKGLKVYYVPVEIGTVNHEKSTWFKGYTESYFRAKGAAFRRISRRCSVLLIIQFGVRKRQLYRDECKFITALSQMLNGRREFIKNHER